MNSQDLIAMAKEIYIRLAANHPLNWDKQALARVAIESATQFALALQSEREEAASRSFGQQQTSPPPGSPTASTEQSGTVYSVLQSLEQRKTTDNPQAVGTGRERQGH